MDYIRGARGNRAETLLEWLNARRDELDLYDVLDVFLDIGRALQAVHERGIIHRDIKPGNILIDRKHKPWLVDFGLIRQADTDVVTTSAPQLAKGLTEAGKVPGTVQYMAPELVKPGQTVDANECSDQFAFCVSLFEALFEHRPYPVVNVSGAYRAIMQHELVQPHEGPFADEVTPKLWQLLRRGLAKNPNERFASMAALNDALADLIRPRQRWRVFSFVSALVLVCLAFGTTGLVHWIVKRKFVSECLTPAEKQFSDGDPEQADRQLGSPSCAKGALRFGLGDGARLARVTDELFDGPDGTRETRRDTPASDDVLVGVIEQLITLRERSPADRIAALDAQRTRLLAELIRATIDAPRLQLAPYMPLTITALLRDGQHDPGLDSQLENAIENAIAKSPPGEPPSPPLFVVFARQLVQPNHDLAAQQLAEYANQATQIPDLRASLWALRAFRLALAALERPDERARLDAAREALVLPESGHSPDPRSRLARSRLELAGLIIDHLQGHAPSPMQLEQLARGADIWWWDHHYQTGVTRLQAPTVALAAAQ
jgi:hypothetical protein